MNSTFGMCNTFGGAFVCKLPHFIQTASFFSENQNHNNRLKIIIRLYYSITVKIIIILNAITIVYSRYFN